MGSDLLLVDVKLINAELRFLHGRKVLQKIENGKTLHEEIYVYLEGRMLGIRNRIRVRS